MKTYGIIFITVVLLGSPSFVSARDMYEITTRVEADRTIDVRDLPDMEDPATPFYDTLRFTISALSTHSFIDLFTRDARASIIVSTWYDNVNEDHTLGNFTTLKGHIRDLRNELLTDHPSLTFSMLVDRRLRGDNLGNADQIISDLMTAGFQFPLFAYTPDDAVRLQKMELLYIICGKHTQNSPTGYVKGLGNLTWKQLFHTEALEAFFSVEDINNTIAKRLSHAAMQGHVLPSPNPAFSIEAGSYGIEELHPLDNGHCCCNYSNHTGGFRTCADRTGSFCTSCGTYCCLAGVQWCPTPSGHGH